MGTRWQFTTTKEEAQSRDARFKNPQDPYCLYTWDNGQTFDSRKYTRGKVGIFEFNRMVLDFGLPTSFEMRYL